MATLPNKEFSKLIASHPILLISSRVGRSNTLSPLTWYLPISIDPPMIGISLKPSSTTYHYVRQSGDFILGIPDDSMLKVVHFCGMNTGKWMDKMLHLNLSTSRGISASPLMLNNCVANIECRVRDIIRTGNRPFITAEVLTLSADSVYYDKGWHPSIRLIYHEGGMKYRIGDEVVDMAALRPGLVQTDSIG